MVAMDKVVVSQTHAVIVDADGIVIDLKTLY